MKKVLILNFFPAFFPPSSGGELRYYHIYNNLSKYFDITLLSPTYNDHKLEIVEHSTKFKEYRIPKETIHNEMHWNLDNENFSPEISALVCAYSGNYINEYHKYYLELYNDSDIIIHDCPYMLNHDLFFGFDTKPRIYNSYNLEYNLVKQIYKGKNAKKHLNYIYGLEKKLVEGADLIFATSEIEKKAFQELYHVNDTKIRIAPNGINPEDYPIRAENKNTALFIGSGHPPNKEAVNFIIDHLADQCSGIKFLLAGACCTGVKTSKKNIHLLGIVSEEDKSQLFKTSELAINPMFSGAGTNLKTLEFLSMGIPMVSTMVGVRGLQLEDAKHFVSANADNFAEKLMYLFSNATLKEKISKESKHYVNQNFAWDKIARNISSEVEKITIRKQKTILVLNDFEVNNPFGGGEIRINRLYSELSNYNNVILLCLNNTNQINKTFIKDNFIEISIPKTKKHIKEENKINSKFWVSATDIVSSYMIQKNPFFVEAVRGFSSFVDTIILCHPYLVEALKDVNHGTIIYESLNYELNLKKKILFGHPDYNRLIKQVESVERESCKKSKLIISVSDDDHSGLKHYDQNTKIETIKNGVETVCEEVFDKQFSQIKKMFKEYPVILFIGSAHPPNIDAANYIINELSQELPQCYFVIIGSVGDGCILDVPSNVLFFGKLPNEYKNVLFRIADIAINPVITGSGSNLKLAEYFAWKLPVVTTPFGVRSYNNVINNENAIICELSLFKKGISSLIENPNKRKTIGEKAFIYANENLDWKILAKKLRNILKAYLPIKKKLLIITYRFTIPPLGGAEVYIYQLLKELDNFGSFDITVASIDSRDIKNQYHFSINSNHDVNTYDGEFSNVTVKKFAFDELSDKAKLNASRELMQNWVDEFRESARRFLNYYKMSLLMGGWNFPETSNNSMQIWSSQKSEIFLSNTKNVVIKGYSPVKKIVKIQFNDDLVKEHPVKNVFVIEIEITENGVLSLECEIDHIGTDVRPLGVLIKKIIIDEKDWLDLNYCYRDFLKAFDLSLYIDEMISIAKTRDEKFDILFQRTRGLNSSEMDTWLDHNIEKYDCILGHSIPFATTIATAIYAKKHNLSYALLPHFHFDDEFYHWQSYYDALQSADCVFAFPATSIEKFYDKLHIKTIEVPGGGILKKEYDTIDNKSFLEVYDSNLPFFLVLGRKSGEKNYSSISEAVEKVNSTKRLCNLVMIGRDEDNIKINSKYTYYLGEQPRSIVLGALKETCCVVTMSSSESFGIVILEAWMTKKPVIINENCPAFAELVQDNINGLYANKKNLSEKLMIILQNKQRACLLGTNGHGIVKKKYLWSIIAENIDQKLLELCEH